MNASISFTRCGVDLWYLRLISETTSCADALALFEMADDFEDAAGLAVEDGCAGRADVIVVGGLDCAEALRLDGIFRNGGG